MKTDRRRHGTEENTPGTRVLPESASRLGGKVSSRDQFGPFRQRRRSLGKPYAPKDSRRPTFEMRSKAKRQVPSYDPEESDTEDEEPETSQTLESPSQDSSVPRKKKRASPAQDGGKSASIGPSVKFSHRHRSSLQRQLVALAIQVSSFRAAKNRISQSWDQRIMRTFRKVQHEGEAPSQKVTSFRAVAFSK